MTNLFKRGMYVLLGLGITVACSDDDDKAIDNNGGGSSSAITNVDFTLTASDDTRTGTVTPSSDGGTLYTVDFGDASTEDDNIQTSGPAVSYTYPAANADYVISVTASASGAEDVTVTKNHTVTMTGCSGGSSICWNLVCCFSMQVHSVLDRAKEISHGGHLTTRELQQELVT